MSLRQASRDYRRKPKWDKLMIVLATFTVLIGLILAGSAVFSDLEDNCVREKEESQFNLSETQQERISFLLSADAMATNLVIQNQTKMVFSDNGRQVSIEWPEFARPFMSRFTNNSNYQGRIDSLKKNIERKDIQCRRISNYASLLLYIALILYLISISIGLKVLNRNQNIKTLRK